VRRTGTPAQMTEIERDNEATGPGQYIHRGERNGRRLLRIGEVKDLIPSP
jgi:hypothetical protein